MNSEAKPADATKTTQAAAPADKERVPPGNLGDVIVDQAPVLHGGKTFLRVRKPGVIADIFFFLFRDGDIRSFFPVRNVILSAVAGATTVDSASSPDGAVYHQLEAPFAVLRLKNVASAGAHDPKLQVNKYTDGGGGVLLEAVGADITP